MKNSILFLAVASMFALASCGEKAPETAAVDTVAAVIDTMAAVVDSVVTDSASTDSVK
jgi:predicted small lipoprotein YifL